MIKTLKRNQQTNWNDTGKQYKVGEKSFQNLQEKNEKTGQEKEYNLILGPEMNTICIVKIIYYVTDFNFQVNIQTSTKDLIVIIERKKKPMKKLGR